MNDRLSLVLAFGGCGGEWRAGQAVPAFGVLPYLAPEMEIPESAADGLKGFGRKFLRQFREVERFFFDGLPDVDLMHKVFPGGIHRNVAQLACARHLCSSWLTW